VIFLGLKENNTEISNQLFSDPGIGFEMLFNRKTILKCCRKKPSTVLAGSDAWLLTKLEGL
jgi:hypothetical protein